MSPEQKLSERLIIESELQTLIPQAESSVSHFVQIGNRFLRVKNSLLSHGEWLPWLKRNGYRPRQPQQYMQAALGLEQFPNIRAKLADNPAMTLQTLLILVRAGLAETKRQTRQQAKETNPHPQNASLILGDSLEWMRSQPDKSFRHIVTDPPFGIGVAYADGWTEPTGAKDYWNWFKPFWLEMKRLVQPRGSIVLFQTHHYLTHFDDWFPRCKIVANCFTGQIGKSWQPLIVWNQPGRRPFKMIQGANSWLVGSSHEKAFPGHPCSKPIQSVKRVIQAFTDGVGPILDPFAGTGTIPLACQQMGIDWRGVERSETYHQIALGRLKSALNALLTLETPFPVS